MDCHAHRQGTAGPPSPLDRWMSAVAPPAKPLVGPCIGRSSARTAGQGGTGAAETEDLESHLGLCIPGVADQSVRGEKHRTIRNLDRVPAAPAHQVMVGHVDALAVEHFSVVTPNGVHGSMLSERMKAAIDRRQRDPPPDSPRWRCTAWHSRTARGAPPRPGRRAAATWDGGRRARGGLVQARPTPRWPSATGVLGLGARSGDHVEDLLPRGRPPLPQGLGSHEERRTPTLQLLDETPRQTRRWVGTSARRRPRPDRPRPSRGRSPQPGANWARSSPTPGRCLPCLVEGWRGRLGPVTQRQSGPRTRPRRIHLRGSTGVSRRPVGLTVRFRRGWRCGGSP